MTYQKPIMEIIQFETENVVCASVAGDYEGPGGDGSDASGDWA